MYLIDTDAGLTEIGSVLSQVVCEQKYVLGYASRTLSKPKQNYCFIRIKLFAAVHFVKHFCAYLYGRKSTVRADYSSLQQILNFKEHDGQFVCWLHILYEGQFDIKHCPSK